MKEEAKRKEPSLSHQNDEIFLFENRPSKEPFLI
jgi:hypothetical protein